MNHLQQIAETIQRLPQLQEWPALLEIIQKNTSRPHFDWELPWFVASAVGVENDTLLAGAAALACMQMSIILVDDILDDDPRGVHIIFGDGPTANMAHALQAACFQLLAEADLPSDRRAGATLLMARMSLDTAFGQQLDIAFAEHSEAQYWSLVQAKSVPFYRAAFELGGVLTGVDQAVQEILGELGTCLGEMIQIHDDMGDALQTPAGPDWLEDRLNLLLLYSTIVDYPQKERFLSLRERISEPEALAEAQNILIQNGSASFAVYHLLKRNDFVRKKIDALSTLSFENDFYLDTTPILQVFDRQIEPVITLLKRHHIPRPNTL